MAALHSGQVLGAFKIVRLLNVGGHGAVYEAALLSNPSERVAIKTLHEELSSHPEISARFRREANVGQKLVHPRIASVIEYGYAEHPEHTAYIVMELIEGESLKKYIRRIGGRIPDTMCVRIFEQISDAIIYAHENGVIHRDLKLGNVMIIGQPGPQEVPSIKLLDFGIAKAIGPEFTAIQTKNSGNILGTYEYMSPEQFTNLADISTQTDVYSLGVMLYYSISGKLPFNVPEAEKLPSAKLAAEYYKLHTAAIPPPLPRDTDSELGELIMQMLEKEPNARPNMRAVRKKLHDLAKRNHISEEPTRLTSEAGEQTAMVPESSTIIPAIPAKWTGRERTLMLIGTVVLVWAIIATLLHALK